MKNLSGWQRIAVIVAVLWFAFIFIRTDDQDTKSDVRWAGTLLSFCRAEVNHTKSECDAEYDKNRAYQGFYWREDLTTATLSVLVFGLLAWVIIAAFRWVRAGFAKDKIGRGDEPRP